MYDELYAAGMEQIVGAQQIVGALPRYASGALPQYQAAYAAGAAAAVAQMTAQGGPPNAQPAGNAIAYGGALGVQQRDASQARLFPLGFVQLAVASLATATITSRPQILFRPQRIVVPASVGTNFVITDIRIGKDSQLVQATELPAEIFSPTAVGVMLTLDTAQQGCDVSLTVRNTDAGAPHDFRATMFGAAVQ